MSQKGLIVHVPLIESTKELRSIDDLDTNIWVASHTLGGGLSDVAVGRKALASRYMAYFIPNYRDSIDPKNRGLYKAGVSWKGDVLVMKMSWDCHRGEHMVEQLEKDDLPWVTECLTR